MVIQFNLNVGTRFPEIKSDLYDSWTRIEGHIVVIMHTLLLKSVLIMHKTCFAQPCILLIAILYFILTN